jgi:hypothetical protein
MHHKRFGQAKRCKAKRETKFEDVLRPKKSRDALSKPMKVKYQVQAMPDGKICPPPGTKRQDSPSKYSSDIEGSLL